MEQFLNGIVLLAVLLDLGVTAATYRRLFSPSEEERNERAVEKAMEQRQDPMDEGFENIMRFSVNGKTGFEQE